MRVPLVCILLGVGDEEDDEDLEIGDLVLNDEEIDTIRKDSDVDTDSLKIKK